jgi:glycerol-3-phosphate acyltransferase PlsX
MPILVDAMGGHNAPQAPVAAAAELSLRRELEITLVGDEALLTAHLAHHAHDPTHLIVRHAEPAEDARLAALHCAARLLAQGHGDALVSAGEPGHLTAIAAQHLQPLPGVPRPALCAVYPTARRRGMAHDPYVLILDVGAALHANPDELLGYARMGSAYASRISRNPRPRVALLACKIGDDLGPPAAADAARLLQEATDLHYLGTLDALDIPQGAADVIVCDGYTGHTVARLLEGVGGIVEQLVRSSSQQNLKWKLALQMISDGLNRMQSIADWKDYGGAPLLGYHAPILVAARQSDQHALSRAIRLAAKAVRADITQALRDGFQQK